VNGACDISPEDREGELKCAVARHDRQADAVLVAAGHQRLEDLLGRQADHAGDGFGGEVVGIDLVLAQLVADAKAIQPPHGVCLGGLHERMARMCRRVAAARQGARTRPDRPVGH
jgi:hypothetical protein